MNPRGTGGRGFSLLEVAITIAVSGFALVALIGALPVGLGEGRTSVDETRAAQLCRMVFSTLESEPFTAARCFASGETPPLDLSRATANGGEDSALLFASYDVQQKTAIVRADQPPLGAEYRIELRFRPVPRKASEPEGAVRGNLVRFKVTRLEHGAAVIMEGTYYVNRLAHGVEVETATAANSEP